MKKSITVDYALFLQLILKQNPGEYILTKEYFEQHLPNWYGKVKATLDKLLKKQPTLVPEWKDKGIFCLSLKDNVVTTEFGTFNSKARIFICDTKYESFEEDDTAFEEWLTLLNFISWEMSKRQ